MNIKQYSKVFVIAFVFLVASCSSGDTDTNTDTGASEIKVQDTTVIDFWNGNRSGARQVYERQVLEALLRSTESEYGPWNIRENRDEYPGDEESLVFSEKDHDLFVTIAGNQKFGEGDMIVIPELLTKNLLGYRIPIIREEDTSLFNQITRKEELRELKHGIPLTWSDAVIFRENGYNVVEDGDFEDIFDRLEAGLFDYSAYGANEVLGVYENRASERDGLTIDRNILLFYQFPLVFYVNPELSELAERIGAGMQNIVESGELDAIFDEHYGDIVEQLKLDQRVLFVLDNPLIPEEYQDLKPDLDDL